MERLKEFILLYRRQCLILGVCLLLLLVYGAYNMSKVKTPISNRPTQQKLSRQSAKPSSAKICVDVKGAVSRPGVYYLPKSSRVKEAIDAAGGVKAEADLKQVNLAKQLQDQQVVFVPLPGEQLPTVMASGSPSNSADTSKGKINLNSASKADLQKIDGVGDKKADKILEYRQQHGQFKSVDELKNISGFGDKTIAKMKDQLAVWPVKKAFFCYT